MVKKKLKIGVLFGGKSAEHEVSLQSARNIIEALDKTKYEVIPIGITKDGKWLLYKDSGYLLNGENPKLIELNKSDREVALYAESHGVLATTNNSFSLKNKVDLIFPVLHGPFGEDGSIQGLLKLAGIPYVGAGILGSAIGMDKEVMKKLLRDAGIPIARFVTIRAGEEANFNKIKNELGMPLFIKPANMGSSIGVSKVYRESDFKRAVRTAFTFDTKIIIEESISGREIECAVLGNEHPHVSIPGEIIVNREFYSYSAKYMDEGSIAEIPARIDRRMAKKIQELAIQVFKILNCEGMGRVDFFLKDNGGIMVNEINTIPGFTDISMYPKLWEASGLPQTKLLDKLIELAIKRFAKEKKLKTSI